MGLDFIWGDIKFALQVFWERAKYEVTHNPLLTAAVLAGVLIVWIFLKPKFKSR